MFVRVLIPPLPEALTYAVPDSLRNQIAVGNCVVVPLGTKERIGYVVGEESDKRFDFAPKEIKKRIGDYPHFLPSQLPFFTWVADYYGTPLANVLEVAIPPFVVQRFERFYALTNPSAKGKGSVQIGIIDALREASRPIAASELSRIKRGAAAALKRLVDQGVVTVSTVEERDSYLSKIPPSAWAKTQVSLNSLQELARDEIVRAVRERSFTPFLLHGVTGSGKTEVYIEAVLGALSENKGALIIVPEIALTPQLIDRFRARLGTEIAVLHSALNKRVRWDSWRALLDRQCRVAIGARSAIFAPVDNLGIIIVDEEHDGSYKQSEGLRYHARDLALVRGQETSCPVILGSATPSLESFYHAMTKRYRYMELPAPHSTAPASTIEIVDLGSLKPREMASRNISPTLRDSLADTLARGEQAFVLYNRRGFAAFFQCDRCQHVLDCPNCSVALTYHQESNSLLCHHCAYSLVPPRLCTKCKSEPPPDNSSEKTSPKGEYTQRGAGTERVFEELQQLFPRATIARLDRDTALDIETYKQILDDVRSGKTQILVGTQMIAKGHDLPGVTLVGIVDCDVGLHMPDFRAGERTFQLLTQAAGRAGRGDRPGKIFLQTRIPQHLSLQRTVSKDYSGFARLELKQRKELGYPPYTRMLRVLVLSPERTYPLQILQKFREHLLAMQTPESAPLSILGPVPAPLVRLKAQWRCHLLLKSNSIKTILKARALLQGLKIRTQKVRVIYDIDPQEML